MPAGRPSAYTEDLATMICDRIADGETCDRSVTTAIFQIGGRSFVGLSATLNCQQVRPRARVPSGRDGRAHSRTVADACIERDGPS